MRLLVTYQETSRIAWRKHISAPLDAEIMECLELHGPMICHDIEEKINNTHQAVSGNLRHLVEKGYVKNSGLKGITPRGRAAIKWQIVMGDDR